jgi:predicted AlkP superfamily phosphohydrolase/phosphomutase
VDGTRQPGRASAPDRPGPAVGRRCAQAARARRVLLLGLDAVSWDVVDALAGVLPNLSRLRAEGSTATLLSTRPPITPVAWTSMVTGVQPGRHGIYEFVRRGEEGWRPTSRRACRAPALDEFLDRAGRRSVLINLPLSYPGRSSAIRLEDFLSASPSPVSPPELKDKVPEIAAYRPFYAPGALGAQSVADVAKDVIDLERRRFAAGRWLLEHEPWQFAFYGITGTDHLQHRALHLILGGGAVPVEVLDLYRLVDEVVGWVVDHLTPEDLLIVASDHGSAVMGREFFLNAWLERQGLLAWRATAAGADRSLRATARRLAVAAGLDVLTRPLRRRLGVRATGPAAEVDEARSRAYMPRRFAWPAVFTPGVEAAELARSLAAVVDPATGRPAFDAVDTADRAYPGERQPGAPDLVLSPAAGVTVHPGRAHTLWRDTRKNHHKPEGILILYGAAAAQLPADLGRAKVEDVCPTVLAALGVSVPAHLDGTSLLPTAPRDAAQAAVRQALRQVLAAGRSPA